MKQLLVITENQFRRVFQTGTVQIWMAVALALVAALAVGARVEHFENGVIWSFFGREFPSDVLLPVAITFILVLGIGIFVPTGIATSVHTLIDTTVVNYFSPDNFCIPLYSKPHRGYLVVGKILKHHSRWAKLYSSTLCSSR